MSDATGVSHKPDHSALRPYAGVLSECRDLIRNRTCSALKTLREAIAEDIGARIQNAAGDEEAQMLAALLRHLRSDEDTLERTFGGAFDHAFLELTRKRRAGDSSLYGRDHHGAIELSLVDDQAFSEALTVKGQANVLHGACEAELTELQPRVALMLGIADLEASNNPVGPEVVSEALKEACWSFDGPRRAKELLFELMARKLAPELNTLYRDVNQHLVMRRVLPRIRHAVKRGGVGSLRSRPRTQEAEAQAGEVLKQLFAPRDAHDGDMRANGLRGNGLRAGGMSAGATDAGIVQMLGRLQQGEPEFTLGGERFGVDANAAATMNVLHGLLDAGLGKHLGTVDSIVIDVVATLFDFVFDDTRVPDAMKGLIGRMQLPVLKLALVDHAFFSNRGHPARRLINAMAQAASTWDGELALDSTLYRTAEPLVLRIQNEACEDSSVFASCLESFEAYLTEQEHEADKKAAALTSRLAQREQLEIARTVAEGAIAVYTDDAELPDTVRQFLSIHWLSVLTEAARSGGEDGTQWRRAVDTMDTLVWSIRPKYGTDERQRLVKLLPELLGGLRAGLDTMRVDAALREVFFAELVKLHAVAVKAGMAPPTPAPSTAQSPPPTVAECVADEPATIEFEDLRRGTWIELRLETGDRRAVRLTWVSPARTMYLFANRQGQRALALTSSELKRKFATGEASLVDDEPLVDRVVAGVLGDYQQAGEEMKR